MDHLNILDEDIKEALKAFMDLSFEARETAIQLSVLGVHLQLIRELKEIRLELDKIRNSVHRWQR